MKSSTSVYVVVTNYMAKPDKKITVHTYGPLTKNQALRLKRAFDREYGRVGYMFKCSINKLVHISDDEIKEASNARVW